MTDSLVPQKEVNGELYGLMPFAIVVCSPISIIGLGFLWFFLGYFENGFWAGVQLFTSSDSENLWHFVSLVLLFGAICAFFYSILVGWPVWALLKKLGLRLFASGVLTGTICALLLMLPLVFDRYFSNNEFAVILRYIVLQSLVGALHGWAAANLASWQLKKKFGV
jgi:hypothetical protein